MTRPEEVEGDDRGARTWASQWSDNSRVQVNFGLQKQMKVCRPRPADRPVIRAARHQLAGIVSLRMSMSMWSFKVTLHEQVRYRGTLQF